MTDEEIAAAEGAARKLLISEYRRTGSKAFIAAALKLRRDGAGMDIADLTAHLAGPDEEPKRRRGRPKIDDTESLFKMVFLVEVRSPRLTVRQAARQVAKATKGHSEASVAERLEDKYRRELPPGVASYRWCAREYRRQGDEARRTMERVRQEHRQQYEEARRSMERLRQRVELDMDGEKNASSAGDLNQ